MKNILITMLLLLSTTLSYAHEKDGAICFIVKENGKVLRQEGNCKARYAPESTFKIVLSMMGFDSNILQDENNPEWPCKEGYDYFINVCKRPHTPRTWMRDSCLWYSRVLTTALGIKKFQDYVQNFNYGNKEIKGDNVLFSSWISSSLQISPIEQTEFIQKFINHKFPISSKAYDMTKKIMFMQELAGGWKLYGKTGNGKHQDKNGLKTDFQHGWFIG